MKKILLLCGLAVAVSAQTFAQQKVASTSTMSKDAKSTQVKAQVAPEKLQAVIEEAQLIKEAPVAAQNEVMLKGSQAATRGANRTITDGVWFQRPEGSLYISGTNYIYQYIPAYLPVTYVNKATDKANSQWYYGRETSLTPWDADADGNMTISWPQISNGYINSAYVPTLTVGDISYRLGGDFTNSPTVALINGDSLQWSAAQVNNHAGRYTGFQNGAVFGTFTNTITVDGQSVDVKANAIQEWFQKPISPLYVASVCFYFVSEESDINKIFASGKTMHVVIRQYNPEAGLVGSVIEDIPFTVNDTIYTGEITSSAYFHKNGFIDVAKKETDAFGTEYIVPFVLDEAFVISIEGFEQEGISFSTYMTNVMGTPTDYYGNTGFVEPTTRTYVRADNGEPINGFYYCQYSSTRQYNANIMLNSMYDIATLYDSSTGVGEALETGGTVYFEYLEPDEETGEIGSSWYTNILAYTTLPFISTWDENYGDDNYYFEGLPDWITLSRRSDADYDDYGLTSFSFTADPLPAGVEGRVAEAYLVSDKGARSEVITFCQGNVAGVKSIKNSVAAKADARVFNLAGQQVSKASKGLYIQNGKKYLVK